MNYFVSYAIKSKDSMMSPITHYGNATIDLPHPIEDATDIMDLQKHLSDIVQSTETHNLVIISFIRLPH